jgi:predicted DNA-binding helix-hairpin-helix protein
VQVACLIENLAKCMMQSALSAVNNVRYHSSLIPTDQSIVEIVGQREDEQVVSVTRRLRERIFLTSFYFSRFLTSKIVIVNFFGFDVPYFGLRVVELLHGQRLLDDER